MIMKNRLNNYSWDYVGWWFSWKNKQINSQFKQQWTKTFKKLLVSSPHIPYSGLCISDSFWYVIAVRNALAATLSRLKPIVIPFCPALFKLSTLLYLSACRLGYKQMEKINKMPLKSIAVRLKIVDDDGSNLIKV